MLDAIFLDREGVITPKLPKGAYVLREEEAVVAPEVLEQLRRLVPLAKRLFIVSNQSCVSRGMISEKKMWEIHLYVLHQLATGGVPISDSRMCPHADEDVCDCRKPKPGMILDLAKLYHVDLSRSVLIGDSETDIEAGNRAGCRQSILIRHSDDTLTDVVDSLMSSFASS